MVNQDVIGIKRSKSITASDKTANNSPASELKKKAKKRLAFLFSDFEFKNKKAKVTAVVNEKTSTKEKTLSST